MKPVEDLEQDHATNRRSPVQLVPNDLSKPLLYVPQPSRVELRKYPGEPLPESTEAAFTETAEALLFYFYSTHPFFSSRKFFNFKVCSLIL